MREGGKLKPQISERHAKRIKKNEVKAGNDEDKDSIRKLLSSRL
jgi:hypothetical protein